MLKEREKAIVHIGLLSSLVAVYVSNNQLIPV